MRDIIINQVFIPILEVVLTTILGIVAYYAKQFYNKHEDFLKLQREQLIQKIGIDKYNKDVALVKYMVATAEQLGKENDWSATLKHSKVIEMLKGKTDLTDDEIYNIIKAAVLEVNSLKSDSVQK